MQTLVQAKGPAAIALVLVLSLAAFLVAAKTHGRQVRLERERAGYAHVVFGGENPPFIEALWKRDRVRYWTTAAAALLVVAAALLAFSRLGVALPLGGGAAGIAWSLVFVPMVLAFLVCAAWSFASLAMTRAVDPAFFAAAWPGSLGWFSLLAALLAGVGAGAVATAR